MSGMPTLPSGISIRPTDNRSGLPRFIWSGIRERTATCTPLHSPAGGVVRYATQVPSDWPLPLTAGLFRGEAVTLWRLRLDDRTLHCFVSEWPGAYWLGVECSGHELVASETLPDIAAVVAHAAELHRSYLSEGWLDNE